MANASREFSAAPRLLSFSIKSSPGGLIRNCVIVLTIAPGSIPSSLADSSSAGSAGPIFEPSEVADSITISPMCSTAASTAHSCLTTSSAMSRSSSEALRSSNSSASNSRSVSTSTASPPWLV